VLQVNVQMTVGSSAETVMVTGGAPLLETETSTVPMTMEKSAIRNLPLNAFGGQDAMNLMLAVTPGVTLIAGLRWDFNFRGREQAGRWQNFDITAQNPLWGGYSGAWVFETNSDQSFYTNEDYHQFGPRAGGAYELKPAANINATVSNAGEATAIEFHIHSRDSQDQRMQRSLRFLSQQRT
jgi:hypothetical protein